MTSRCPTASGWPSSLSATATCARRRASAAGAVTKLGERPGTGRQRGVVGSRLGAAPTARRAAVGPGVEIVAQGGGERGLIARRDAQLVEDAVFVAASGGQRAFERRGLAVERGQRGARFGQSRFDACQIGGGRFAVRFGVLQRGFGRGDRGFGSFGGLHAVGMGRCQRGAVAQRGDFGVDARLVARDAADRGVGAVAGRYRDAAIGGLARGLGARLRQRNLGVAEPRLRGEIGVGERRLARVVRGDGLRQRFGFGIERGQRAMRFAGQFAFAAAVVGEARLLRRQIVEALARGALLALQADLRRGCFGQRVALHLRILPRGGDAGRDLGLRGGDGFELVLRGFDRSLGSIRIAARLIGGGGGIAPARVDQPRPRRCGCRRSASCISRPRAPAAAAHWRAPPCRR